MKEGTPILYYTEGLKSGDGFDSGEYDIYPNGSLIIKNVTVWHEAVFRVTKIFSGTEPTFSYHVAVYAIGEYQTK